ncbi:MAG: hypothetical protein IJF17_10195 [Thermoguttaceae bacterium]|nr:hypothetical protein [Thermoguttaceae bacterium]
MLISLKRMILFFDGVTKSLANSRRYGISGVTRKFKTLWFFSLESGFGKDP